mgnify:CR=1
MKCIAFKRSKSGCDGITRKCVGAHLGGDGWSVLLGG